MTPPKSRRISLTALLLASLAATWLAGCATTEATPVVSKVSDDVYMITIKAKSSYFAMDKPKFKSQAVSASLDVADSKGKVALPITLREKTYGAFDDWVNIEYEFRLVDKNDPRAHRAQPGYDADEAAAIAAAGKSPVVKPPEPVQPPVAVSQPPARSKQKVYNDLLKLDELRKKGIITQAEFETEKAKLLAK